MSTRFPCLLLLAQLLTGASAHAEAPEDLALSDLLLDGPPARNFFHTSVIAGTGSFWSAEIEVGRELPSGWQIGVLGAHSQVSSSATDEGWLTVGHVSAERLSFSTSALYGYGPTKEKYYGATLAGIKGWDRWRLKMQSGALRFNVPAVTVNGSALDTFQFPLRMELAHDVTRDLTLAVGGAFFIYTENSSRLAQALGATTITTGSGILSGFPLNQIYAKAEFDLSSSVMGSLTLSSALSAYQSSRITSLGSKFTFALGRDCGVGAELSVSRSGTGSWNAAVGPSFRAYW